MKKKKQIYESPDMTEIRVELESSICSGSVDINATSPGVSTTAQQENTGFGNDNDFSNSNQWD